MRTILNLLSLFVIVVSATAHRKAKPKTELAGFSSETFSTLKFRSIGPTVTLGRISDLAVNPTYFSEYHVASSSGGVWKTTNRGVSFQPSSIPSVCIQ
jgi:hypothetical protein